MVILAFYYTLRFIAEQYKTKSSIRRAKFAPIGIQTIW